MADLNEKKLAKRIKLLEAASELFLEKGVNTTAIDEVVKRAGVAKGTFYLYFRDKYDLVDQIVVHKGEQIFHAAMEQLRKAESETPLSLKESLGRITDYIIDYLCTHKELVALIKKNLSACLSVVLDPERTENRLYLEALYVKFETGGRTREETRKYLYLLTSMLSSVCCDAILYQEPYTIEEIRPQVHEILERVAS